MSDRKELEARKEQNIENVLRVVQGACDRYPELRDKVHEALAKVEAPEPDADAPQGKLRVFWKKFKFSSRPARKVREVSHQVEDV